jgi:hypothetical protein
LQLTLSCPGIFFHVYHDHAELDYEGEELPDKHAAWRKATVTAGQILQGIDGKLKPDREWRMGSNGTNSRNCSMYYTPMQRNPNEAASVGDLNPRRAVAHRRSAPKT